MFSYVVKRIKDKFSIRKTIRIIFNTRSTITRYKYNFKFINSNFGYLFGDEIMKEVADTLDEMAEKLGCDKATLQATVDAFNNCVDGKETDEFGRTLYSVKLENGPWVATPRQACVHHTMGGVRINTNAEVLDVNGNPIPGLWAAGEVTGGIHAGNRLGGNAVADIFTFGKIAGNSASK